MHTKMLDEVIKVCLQRQREGDRPTINNFSVEILEDAVVELATRLKIVTDPDIECEAGVLHPEAPRQ